MKRTPLKRKPFKKKKLSEKTLVKRLYAKAWPIFSKWIRKRDGNKCVTCETTKPPFNAGHYKHGALDFDEININCQCTRCNNHLNGNLTQYALYLENKYGHGILQDLERRKREYKKYTSGELQEIIEKYSEEKGG